MKDYPGGGHLSPQDWRHGCVVLEKSRISLQAQLFVQLVEQCFGLLQVGGIEAFGEARIKRA
jgi:hypothetical protein